MSKLVHQRSRVLLISDGDLPLNRRMDRSRAASRKGRAAAERSARVDGWNLIGGLLLFACLAFGGWAALVVAAALDY